MTLKKIFGLAVFLLISNASIAQSTQLADEKKYSGNITVSPMNFPLPMSFGINGYYKINNQWSIGADYLRSNLKLAFFSLEVGETTETNFTIQAKRHFGESFNLKMGFGSRKLEILFADDLLDLASSEYQETASELSAKYIRFGLGNVWQFNEDYRFEVDWLTVDIPVNANVETSASQYANSDDSKQTIENAEGILKYYPGGSIFKFSVGMVF